MKIQRLLSKNSIVPIVFSLSLIMIIFTNFTHVSFFKKEYKESILFEKTNQLKEGLPGEKAYAEKRDEDIRYNKKVELVKPEENGVSHDNLASKAVTPENKDTEKVPEPEEKEEEKKPPAPPSGCPRVTKNCFPCQAGETYCRYEQGEDSGYLGWACQNNNPSNIRYSSYRINLITSMGGNAPCADRGGFMAFNTYSEGFQSVKAYIRAINTGMHFSYVNAEYDGEIFTCGDCTLLQFFSKYAPNNPVGYTDGVVSKIGGTVTPDTKLQWIVNNRLDDFVEAIKCMEGFFIDGGIKWCKFS